MTSDRVLQLSAAVEAMPEGPSRRRFGALLAELSAAEGVPVPAPVSHLGEDRLAPEVHDADTAAFVDEVPPDDAVGAEEPASSPLDGLLGPPPVPAPVAAFEEPKKRRWRRS